MRVPSPSDIRTYRTQGSARGPLGNVRSYLHGRKTELLLEHIQLRSSFMSLAELEKEVLKLSPGELSAFTRWLDDYASRLWDEQIERDVAAGRLDQLGRKADEDFEAGQCSEL